MGEKKRFYYFFSFELEYLIVNSVRHAIIILKSKVYKNNLISNDYIQMKVLFNYT